SFFLMILSLQDSFLPLFINHYSVAVADSSCQENDNVAVDEFNKNLLITKNDYTTWPPENFIRSS
ncbi:MAG: hypothetical protein ACXV76_07945, partial [Halobacteriota archaeon]